MSRGLWFVAGAGAGVYAMVRGRRAAEALTADGLRDRVGAAWLGARMLREEVAQGRAEAAPVLRERLHRAGATGPPELGPAGQDAPTSPPGEIAGPSTTDQREGST
ncbi:DUF6167 family protein [Nocardioides nanhaiensis]|uniref:YtxH domain-containing protein n=1 Tax=Nocardioides nanhaiensis TaxID=1476871 RepID=A0ABP8WKU1_9ACTN